MKFKRAFLMEPHRFEIHEVEEEPGPGEVMMKVASCGPSCGTVRASFRWMPRPDGGSGRTRR